MPTLLALIGEQPTPTLLPERFLRPERTLLLGMERLRPAAKRLLHLLPHATIEETDPYDLPRILARLAELAPAHDARRVCMNGWRTDRNRRRLTTSL